MRVYIKYIFLGIIMVLTLGSDDPPKQDTIKIDTTIIQKEQIELQKEQVNRMGIWDSLLTKQDTLIKKK